MAAGRFLSFEGVDGSGKSTQARLLADALRKVGHAVTLTREPGGSPGAEEIRRLVLEGAPSRWSPETEILLFTAARRDHLEKTIRPALARGDVVITDRFADSTRMYQGISRGDLAVVVDQLHDLMIGVEPDLTFLIDMAPKKALERSLKRLADEQSTFARSKHTQAEAMESQGLIMSSEMTEAISREASDKAKALKGAAALIREGRMPEDRFETFGGLFQAQMRDGFLALAKSHPTRFRVINGDRAPAEVASDVTALATVHLT